MARIGFFEMLLDDDMSWNAETIACPRCGQPVPPRLTVMTEQGLVCERCHALVP